MKCPTCVLEGRRSKLHCYGGVSRTLLGGESPWFDEDGQYHEHDPNIERRTLQCSNGHRWLHTRFPACASCGWSRGPEEWQAIEAAQ